MMIQKVINYDWDEKWGFGNYDNNWWKAQISIAAVDCREGRKKIKDLAMYVLKLFEWNNWQ